MAWSNFVTRSDDAGVALFGGKLVSTPKKIAGWLIRIALAVLIVGLVFFVIGFGFGYFMWLPRLPASRLRQAIDNGLFFVCVSLILDPVVIVSLIAYLARKRKDSVEPD